jgi:hypothetical protein
MHDLARKQEWRRRALLERYGRITPAMEKVLKMDESVDQARGKVGDPAFDRGARRRFWLRFGQYFVAASILFMLAIVSYLFVYPLNELAAFASVVTISLVAAHFFGKSWTCAACGGPFVVRFPIYCVRCGETYLFHGAGQWLFKRRQAGIERAVKAHMEQKFGHQDRLLAEADKILSSKDSGFSPDELARLNAISQEVGKGSPRK